MENKNTFKGRLKSDICSMSWWYGALGSVLSTVVGIALTFGVSAWVSYRHDKQEAREMMFNVVLSAKESIEAVSTMDSLYDEEISAFNRIFEYYMENEGDLEKVSKDSLTQYLETGFNTVGCVITWSKTGSYFYGAETMHQFDNPEMYGRFSSYVEYEEQVLEKIIQLRKQGKEIYTSIRAKQVCEQKSVIQALEEIIKDHTLYNYAYGLYLASLKEDVKNMEEYYHSMLKEMGATEEELEEYEKATDDENAMRDKAK